MKSHQEQQNSSFGLIKTYLALLAWKRILYIVYKLNPVPDSDFKRTQILFLQTLRTNKQGWQNLQKFNNAANSKFLLWLFLESFLVSKLRSETWSSRLSPAASYLQSDRSVVIARLMSTCLWIGWKWLTDVGLKDKVVMWIVNVRERKPHTEKKSNFVWSF